MDHSVPQSRSKTTLIALCVFAFYVVAAKLGLMLAIVNASATAIWAPTGIALAAFLIFGKRFWPSIFAGAFLVNLLTAGNLTTSLVIAAGNTLEGLLGAWLIQKFANGRHVFERATDILKFVVFTAPLGTLISPSLGVTILCLEGFGSWKLYWDIWMTWWLGDLTGALLVTPFLILWYDDPHINRRRFPISLISFLIVLGIGEAVFGNWLLPDQDMDTEFLCIPPLIWIAYRFGVKETATASILLCGIALMNTVRGVGPFALPSHDQALLLLQVFMSVISVTSLALAAAISERKTAEENLERAQRAEKKLQEKIELIQLLHSITVAANESADLPEAVQLSLMLICRYTGWPVGHVYYLDPNDNRRLIPGAQWFIRDEQKYKNLKKMTENTLIQVGEGLVGKTFANADPQWIEDLTVHPDFARAKKDPNMNIRACFGFPVMIGKNVVAVLEFFTDHSVPPNSDLMESMKHVGTQLGRIMERHQAEQAQSELALLVETSSDFIVTTNPEGYILYLNEAGRAMVGLEKNTNVRILRHVDFIFEADIPKLLGPVMEALMTRGHWEGEFQLKNFQTGRPVPTYFSAGVLKDPKTGLPTTLAAIGHDVTYVKQAESEIKNTNSFLITILENIPNMIFVKDARELRFVMFNRAGEELIGVPKEKMIGKNDYDFFPKEQADFFTGKDKKVIAEGSLIDIPEESIQTQNKGNRILHTKKIPVLNEDGSPRFLLGISEDITEQKNTQREFQKQAQLLQSIIDNMGEGLLVCDAQGKTLFVNPSADHMLGGQIGDPLPGGKPQKNEVYKADGETILSPDEFPVTRALYGEPSDNVELFIKNPKKREGIYITGTSRPIRDSEGKITGAVSVFRDITDQKIVEKTLRETDMRFRSVVQSSPNAIIVADSHGNILLWNKGAEMTFGYSEEEILDKPLIMMMAPKYRETHEINESLLKKTNGAALVGKTVELKGLKKNGSEFPMELSLSSWNLEGEIYFGGILRDITERKKMEELLRSNTELQQFANVASHDLQEPLRMVASYVQLLSEHLKGKLDQDALDYMGFAVDGAKRMQALVNGLLEYSRVESKSKSPQTVDMNQVLKQTLSNLEILIAETGAKINHAPLPHVLGDPVQLTQLMQNLFSNALKFQKSGAPEIDFSTKETENEWEFACQDNGIGIDPKYFDRIFIIFQRLHHRDEYSGTGVGLAICKRIVERHGGRIWVESLPNEGSTFFFTLPKRSE